MILICTLAILCGLLSLYQAYHARIDSNASYITIGLVLLCILAVLCCIYAKEDDDETIDEDS